MRVCTARQMALIDQQTISDGVPGEVLMERAGTMLTEALLEFLEDLDDDHGHGCGGACGESEAKAPPQVLIICGKGNNGGDGLVMARHLDTASVPVTVLLLGERSALSPDTALNFERLPAGCEVITPHQDDWVAVAESLLEDADVVVDAIFGTGVTPPLRGAFVDLIRTINDTGVPCLAVDIPSGVNGDDGCVAPVAAEMTVTVGLPKRGLFMPPGRDFTGDIEVVDIGFQETICGQHTDNHHWLPREDYLALLPARPSDIHKYRAGCLLAICGSREFGGAAQLTGMGALRSGAGLVTLAVPESLETAVHTALPEVITIALAESDAGTIEPVPSQILTSLLERKDAVAVGPGLGVDPDTDAWVLDLLETLDRPLVVDADALSAFGRLGRSPKFNTNQVVLTPHAGELARMLSLTSGEVMKRRFELVPELAARWQVVLMLKGSPSLIGAPDGRLFINAGADDALARGGSGDVLTGLIGGLLAQGQDALSAALLGAYLHGQAGNLAADAQGTRSVLVREIASAIGPVFVEMEKEASSSARLRERIWPVV